MRRPRVFFLALAVWCLMLGKARAQYAYVTHPNALVESRATTAVLPANPLRAFVYCVIASPGKGEPLARFLVVTNRAKSPQQAWPYTTQIAHPQLWGKYRHGLGLLGSETALVSCTELAIPPYRTPLHGGTN